MELIYAPFRARRLYSVQTTRGLRRVRYTCNSIRSQPSVGDGFIVSDRVYCWRVLAGLGPVSDAVRPDFCPTDRRPVRGEKSLSTLEYGACFECFSFIHVTLRAHTFASAATRETGSVGGPRRFVIRPLTHTGRSYERYTESPGTRTKRVLKSVFLMHVTRVLYINQRIIL